LLCPSKKQQQEAYRFAVTCRPIFWYTGCRITNRLNNIKTVPCGTDGGRLLLSGFQSLVTLTLDPVIRHTVLHQSSTSIYIPNFIEIGKNFFSARTNGRDPLEVEGNVAQKLGQISKIRPDQI